MKKNIRPSREGLLVRKSDGQRLHPEGEDLLVNAWWLRREAEGDVAITDIPANVQAETLKKPAMKEK